jgi:hypothetical protein
MKPRMLVAQPGPRPLYICDPKSGTAREAHTPAQHVNILHSTIYTCQHNTLTEDCKKTTGKGHATECRGSIDVVALGNIDSKGTKTEDEGCSYGNGSYDGNDPMNLRSCSPTKPEADGQIVGQYISLYTSSAAFPWHPLTIQQQRGVHLA